MVQVRWYRGYKYRKNPQELIKLITQKIHEENLSQYIPLLRLEKGVKPRGDFYFFLAIESPQAGQIPQKVMDSKLLKLPFFQTEAVKGLNSFKYEEIKSMVGISHDVHDYTNPIPYQPLPKIIIEHPFNFTVSQQTNSSPQNIDISSHRHEHLIYWLSAIRSGTWELFDKTCNQLEIKESKRVLRRLKLLGHLEVSADGKRWSIAPTAMVQISINSDLQEFIICGQRSINLIKYLQKYTNLKSINQPRGDAPPCIYIQVDQSVNICALLKTIGTEFSLINVGEVSKKLVNILPNINTWKQNLRDLQGIVTTCYEWERFDNNDFVACDFPSESGMYRMYNLNIRADKPLRTLFHDRESNLWLQGDWYGLRFLALQQMEHKCIFNYDLSNKQLAILASQRFPEIYERALVLASGKLPTYVDSWLVYTNIELEMLVLLSAKLNLICAREFTYA
ncbi:hypothetical protein [Calothrix sp. PCC 6303]|uniref:hypothetical protein n=1 Tax=Calothrix sp. PCC 6303 TaxID=1170562 RepID=UPI0002A01756|nr:hypothetical protein [Calothrix sp. PCC 6303]AFZ04647.1 hypothetical protein Cal6303_5785 [Calothrix sp. PCC 6303]